MLYFLKIDFFDNIDILIIIILFFFSFNLITKNKRLKVEIKNLRLVEKTILDNNKKVDSKKDVFSIDNISKEVSIKQKNVEKKNDLEATSLSFKKENLDCDSNQKENIKKDVSKNFKTQSSQNFQQKNKKNNIKKIPISTEKVIVNKSKNDILLLEKQNNIEKISFNLNDYVKNGKSISKKSCSPSKLKSSKDNQDYLKEISKKMADELKPQTIELTDYEKDQEENAIISYQELLNVKDKINILNDDETVDFIEELKKLRNSLN